jgi:ABC-type sulfate transport system permease subunit
MMKINLLGNLLLLLLLLPVIRAVIKTARSGRNPLKQSLPNPTPAMTAVWFVVLLALIVAAISTAFISIVLFAIYDGILPTAPDAFSTHPTQVMGHRAYLNDFLDLLFAVMWRVASGSIVAGFAALCAHSILSQRESDRRHNIRIEWMKSRPE